MGAIKFTTSIVLTGLFIIAVIGFSMSFASNNDVAVSLADDQEFLITQEDTIGKIKGFKNSSDSGSLSYLTTQANGEDETSESGNQFKAGIKELTEIATNSISIGYKKIFGQEEGFGIFLTALIGMLVFMTIAVGYKYWFGKNPD